MGLTYATAFNQLTWTQEKVNVGFTNTIQGPDSTNYPVSFNIEATGVNTVYALEDTLLPLATLTIDLTNLTDFFNDPLLFTRVYTLQVASTDANLQVGPAPANSCLWFWGSNSDYIEVKAGSNFAYNSDYPFPVVAGASDIQLYNPSATTTLTFKIVIIGGQGAGTTTTTTTTATTAAPTTTTTSSSSTSATTSSSSTSGTTTSTTTT